MKKFSPLFYKGNATDSALRLQTRAVIRCSFYVELFLIDVFSYDRIYTRIKGITCDLHLQPR
jgi:hypothetical protein